MNIFCYRYEDQSSHGGHVTENCDVFSGYNSVTPLSKPPVKDGSKFFSVECRNGFGQLSLLLDTKESRTVGKH